ncbi:sensor histidine kinase [Roseiconus lacunae]|uniref:histidine kinase n=1 Tax=Roseiconus lacunae TaxID=2605694 RepID=A0ABT7PGM8_9BACT|nr:ATP-binding protein [Roseiconus lacunae]MDM4015637.1 ATP-binding protein [Roseiconus lacunae]
MDLSLWIFSDEGFPARWFCGSGWTDEPYVGWIHVVSDLVTWASYLTIPVLLMYFATNRRDVTFPKVFWLFCAFIISCGMVHLVEAVIFWWPVYRLSAVLKLVTAIVSAATAIALIRVFPVALSLPALATINQKLQTEIETRKLAEEKLERINLELESFVSIASHDLQEPLRNVISFTELLKEDLGDNLSDNATQDLKYISSAASRMQRLINDLLTFSRTTRHGATFQIAPVDDCVDEALEILQSRLEQSGGTITRSNLPKLKLDITLVAQLYQNLISNAIKFTESDRSPQIDLTAEMVDGVWVLGVRDNGIGIESKYTDQIFEPFKRLHGMSEYEGTGIGLAVCKTVVEHHGGQIWVTSHPGEGSHFQFTLEPFMLTAGVSPQAT